LHDPIGASRVLQVNSSSLLIYIYNVTKNTNVRIAQFHHVHFTKPANKIYIISLVVYDHFKEVNITLSQIKISDQTAISIDINETCTSVNSININNLQLISKNWIKNHLPKASKVISMTFSVFCTTVANNSDSLTYIQFNSCQFTNIDKDTRLISIRSQQTTHGFYPIIIHIKNSSFSNINKTNIIVSNIVDPTITKPLVTLILANSMFKYIHTS